jgi:hypothetical protein
VVVAVHVYQAGPQIRYVTVTNFAPEPVPGLAIDGTRVENVYPYSRDGRLLQDVQLFDQAGRSLDVRRGDQDPRRRTPQAVDGRPLFNAFPIRYFEQGTRRVARPAAGAPVTPPKVTTAPVRAERPKRAASKRRR